MNKEKLKSFVNRIEDFHNLIHSDKITVFGYYLQENLRYESFNHKNIEECYDALDLPRPTNIPSRLLELKKVNRLVPYNKSKGSYRVSGPESKTIEGKLGNKELAKVSDNLTKLPKLLSKPESDLLKEALNCLKVKALRAVIVLVWIIVIDHLQDFVIRNKLADFNTALSTHTRYQRLTITKKEDFEEIKESDFISIMKTASIITKGQKKLLDEKLGIRNTYAHPSSLTLSESKVNSFVEDLIVDIVSKIK